MAEPKSEKAAPVAKTADSPSEKPAEDKKPVFELQRCYLKDLSLEQPNSPKILLEKTEPKVDIRLAVDAEPLSDDAYEIAVSVTVTTTTGEKTLFLVEGKQAGIFAIRNIPQEHISMVLNVNCAQIIYPYLRAIISDTVVRAGFPPVYLTELNFHALWEERQRQADAISEKNLAGKTTPNGKA